MAYVAQRPERLRPEAFQIIPLRVMEKKAKLGALLNLAFVLQAILFHVAKLRCQLNVAGDRG